MSTSTGQVAVTLVCLAVAMATYGLGVGVLWKDVGTVAGLAAIVAPLIGLALFEQDRRDGPMSRRAVRSVRTR